MLALLVIGFCLLWILCMQSSAEDIALAHAMGSPRLSYSYAYPSIIKIGYDQDN